MLHKFKKIGHYTNQYSCNNLSIDHFQTGLVFMLRENTILAFQNRASTQRRMSHRDPDLQILDTNLFCSIFTLLQKINSTAFSSSVVVQDVTPSRCVHAQIMVMQISQTSLVSRSKPAQNFNIFKVTIYS